MSPKRNSTVLLAALCLAAGCSKPAPVPEEKAVHNSYEALLFVPDPDMNLLMLHAAWLGPESVGPIIKVWPEAVANDAKRIKLAQLLEVLAWNGIRSKESAKLLAGMSKDRHPQVRAAAINGLFASTVNLDRLDKYWDPSDSVPGHVWNPLSTLKLPFENCRTLLAARGVGIARNPDGSVAGDPGRPHAEDPPVQGAANELHRWWSTEKEPAVRVYAAIQALRLGDFAAAELLISVLAPPPEGVKRTATTEALRASSLRVLQETAGETLVSWEDWSAWWQKHKPEAPKQPRDKPLHPPR